MKKIKIGIPRTNIYNKYGVFFKHFFLCLNCKIILSPETNNKIIKTGENNLSYSNCKENKIYFGHIKELASSCNYILISTECNKNSNCINYYQFLENIKQQLLSSQILFFNPNKNNFIEILKIAIKITKNPLKILYSYLYAKERQKNYNTNIQNNQKNKLNRPEKKVLLVTTNIHNNIIKKLENKLNSFNIVTIFSNYLPEKDSLFFSKNIKNKQINKEIKRQLGSVDYYQYSIKAIIYIKTQNCILDDYIYSLIKENTKTKNIIILENELNTDTYIELLTDTANNY